MSNEVSRITNGTALAPISDPVELGERITRLDAWLAALRAIGDHTEELIDATYEAMERRIEAVKLYDDFDPERSRPEIKSFTQVNDLTAKQKALTDLGVARSTIHAWRKVKENVPADKRTEMYLNARERLDEKFGIESYFDAAKQNVRAAQKQSTQEQVQDILAHYDEPDTPNSISVASIYELDLPAESIDMVFTDPPYHDEYIDLYNRLAEVAEHALKPGGYCMVYAGKMFIPDLINCMIDQLEYVSIFAVFQPFSQSRIMKHNIFENWRPILVFKKPGKTAVKEWAQDVVRGTRDKSHHEWQQDSEAPLQYIAAYTKPGDVVLDPFVGGGTTPWACKQLGRYFVAFDIDEEAVKLSTERVTNE